MTDAGWQELRFSTTPDQLENLESWLFEQGALAVTLEDNADEPLLEPGPGETPLWQNIKLVALFEVGINLSPILASVPQQWVTASADAANFVPDQDWARAWMENFEPLKMGKRLWICPSWCEPPDPHAVNINLDPGLAFGTGTHPTTAMCLGELDATIQPGINLIDYGCGSGILAIAGLKLGATKAFAVDNDPQAVTATWDNAQRNAITQDQLDVFLVSQADTQGRLQPADLVIANILAGPLEALAPTLIDLMNPGGRLILAGLLSEQAAALIEAYKPWVALSAVQELEGWTLLAGPKLSC
ncbi:MAG: 50S ribosomal protein L11 methyltransferase [Halieaceae bacterium]|nr:50S ribosomal protein L11 methyltransferase [Halieaceae bacterium]